MSKSSIDGAVRFTPASPVLLRTGLIGWACFTVGGLKVYGVAVRRTREGSLALSYPTRRDRSGREHGIVHPIDAKAHAEIERQVLAAIVAEVGP